MQLVEEELFRVLLTTGEMVLVDNLINISYPTTQFFFSLTCRINVITDNFALSAQPLRKQENCSSRSFAFTCIESD